MQETRYTEKQILCGIVESLIYTLGIDQDEAQELVSDVEVRIDLSLKKANEWQEFDFSEFVYQIERFFHFEYPSEDRRILFGLGAGYQSAEEWIEHVGQHLTFRALVESISEHAPRISFQPVMVIDRECGPAGAFYGMQELSEKFYPAACQLTPSTRILDAFRGAALDRFWSELKWRTDNSLTELKYFWFLMEGCGCLVFWPVLLISVILFLNGNYLYPVLATATTYSLWKVFSICSYRFNPLPAGYETFRDLAVMIAEHDSEAVNQSVEG
ncbi:MAG TPA: hypothetical protein DCY03_15970 [Planctomycetaceae bacterium]|uniref:hypothetical protein n=1 Tax=Gimesia maris TaxID=122 RepID=UPI000E851CF2|nr:hypothetical protein [Planctomycetaceae bacterium]|tara:strand:- start:98 stop:910 length:813 start_codon:yes stop_codon:yes gene_type:complete